jgi:hypothetical protein
LSANLTLPDDGRVARDPGSMAKVNRWTTSPSSQAALRPPGYSVIGIQAITSG